MQQMFIKFCSGGKCHQGSVGMLNILDKKKEKYLYQLILNSKEFIIRRTKCFGCQALVRTWKLFSDLVAPAQSPKFATFFWHPNFLTKVSNFNSRPWVEKVITQFYSIGRR